MRADMGRVCHSGALHWPAPLLVAVAATFVTKVVAATPVAQASASQAGSSTTTPVAATGGSGRNGIGAASVRSYGGRNSAKGCQKTPRRVRRPARGARRTVDREELNGHHRPDRRASSGNLRRAKQQHPHHFAITYGDESSDWYIGVVSEDVVDIGGLRATSQPFGLVLLSDMHLVNPFPDYTGPPAADGLIGLMPGCINNTSCEGGTDDLISTFVRSGLLEAWGFTMCHNDSSEGGGKLYFGLPANHSVYPGGTQWLPLKPIFAMGAQADVDAHPAHHFSIAPPTDGSDVTFRMGDVEVGRVPGTHLAEVDYIVDSGSYGTELPQQVADSAFMSATQAIFEDDHLRHVISSLNVPEGMPFDARSLADHLVDGGTLELSTEVAMRIQQLVPDIVVNIGDANVMISGSTFIYDVTGCSGVYASSWFVGDDDNGFVDIGGTAFLLGKTVTYDLSDPKRPRLGVLDHTDGCHEDYSQGGLVASLQGSRSQVLHSAVYTAELAIGTPAKTLIVQVDTGSDVLMVPSESCRFANDPCIQFTTAAGATMVGSVHDEDDCTGIDAPQPMSLAEFLEYAASQLQSSSTCTAEREACGFGAGLDPSNDSTYRSLPAGSSLPSYTDSYPVIELDLDDLECSADCAGDDGGRRRLSTVGALRHDDVGTASVYI